MVLTDGPLVSTFQARLFECEHRVDFRDGKRGHRRGPKSLQRCLLESEGSRHIDVTAKERMKLFAHEYAQGCKHRNTPMLQFDLAIEEKLTRIYGSGEAQGVEVIHWRANTR